MKNCTYLSNRGIPLLYIHEPCDKPVVTLENYTKWYNIFLVMPDGSVAKVDSGDYVDIPGWFDHLYHPDLLRKLAEKLNAYECERSIEVATGRWIIESGQPL